MAGSDLGSLLIKNTFNYLLFLDGDEYAVIWDPELALERNEPAADYSPVREEAADSQNSSEIDIVDFHTEMAAFFVNYLKNDSIGRISNAHLFNSDLYGLNAQVSIFYSNNCAN
jgi:RNA-dependent RNA polymerase